MTIGKARPRKSIAHHSSYSERLQSRMQELLAAVEKERIMQEVACWSIAATFRNCPAESAP